jgi:hypothetical protein
MGKASKRQARQRRDKRPLTLILLGVILMGAALIFWGYLSAQEQQNTASLPVSAAEVPRVSQVEARQAYDSNEALFLDVRTPEEYEQSHIPGAVLMPLDELPDRMAELPQNRWIITYCT